MITAQHQLLLGSRVLVAEDDVILALDMERSLRDAGAEIFGPAKTEADATALARTAPLTCAVLDVNLGCELVFPVAHVLRERVLTQSSAQAMATCTPFNRTGRMLRSSLSRSPLKG